VKRGGAVGETLRYKPEGRRFHFHSLYSHGRIIAWGRLEL